ncbi:MAG: alanine:cation symporter family protein [Candidatus Gastranaerophilaceae bacterium]
MLQVQRCPVGGPELFSDDYGRIFSMALKFAEVLLGLKFRKVNADEQLTRPMYYIEGALKNNKYIGRFAPHLSKIYAVCCIFAMIGGWNLFQINAMTTQITEVTGGNKSFFAEQSWLLGLIVAVITYFTIIGGIKAIGKFTSKVTPVICTLYVITAFSVCLLNIQMSHTFVVICTKLSPKAMAGGMFACMLWG